MDMQAHRLALENEQRHLMSPGEVTFGDSTQDIHYPSRNVQIDYQHPFCDILVLYQLPRSIASVSKDSTSFLKSSDLLQSIASFLGC